MRPALRAAMLAAAMMIAASCAPSPVPTRAFTTRTQTALASCPSDGGPAVPPTAIDVGGRKALLVAPAGYTPGVAHPLLVSLHPFIVSADGWEIYSGLAAAASARGYWVLAPQGSDPGPRWDVPGGLDTGVDDIGWVESLIQTTASTVCVDASRVFAAGFSAGAAMSVGLTCELPWRFRAIAASGGANLTSLCPDAGATDALILHGSADPIAPLTGNTIEFTPPVGLHVDDVVANFAHRNGCGATPSVTSVTPSVTDDVYACGSHRLTYRRVQGGGHTWAGATIPLDIVTGPTDQSFSATTAVLDFFDA